jgi:hypothetical protein
MKIVIVKTTLYISAQFKPLFSTTFNCLGGIWYRSEEIGSFMKIVIVKTTLYISA